MQYRTLGNTGIKVSEIGLGCSGFWGDKRFPDNKAIDIVLSAFERGVNFFDTGSNYSNFNAEPRLGRAISEVLRSAPRRSLVISTKAGSNIGYAPTVADDDLHHADFSPDALRRSCENSIRNLNSDYIDVFQLHGFKPELLNDEVFQCLDDMKSEGLVKSVGVNTHFKADLEAIAKHPDVFDMVLIDANVLQLDRKEIIQTLTDAGIGVAVGTVLAQGHLVSRKIGSLRDLSFFWYLARTLIKPTTKDFARAAAPMRRALRSIDGVSPAQAAFAYMLRDPNVATCVFGTTNLDNLLDAVAASEIELPQHHVDQINRVAASIPSLSR